MWWHQNKVPLCRVDELALLEGQLARVVGRATPSGELLAAPYTRRSCIAAASMLEMVGSAVGHGGNSSNKVSGVDLASSFVLDDDSGLVAVLVSVSTIHLELDLESVIQRPSADDRPLFGANIVAHEIREAGGEWSHHSEALIVAGDVIAAIGLVRKAEAGGYELVGTADKKLILTKHAEQLV